MAPIIARAAVDRAAAQVFGYATAPPRFSEWQKGVVDGHLNESDPRISEGGEPRRDTLAL
jgi:hypothetical protein